MAQLVWFTLLAVHVGGAAVWWWLAPGGPARSPTDLWVDQIGPWLVIAILLLALLARGRLSQKVLPPILAAIPLFWMSFGLSAKLTFTESFRSLWNLPVLGGFALGALW